MILKRQKIGGIRALLDKHPINVQSFKAISIILVVIGRMVQICKPIFE